MYTYKIDRNICTHFLYIYNIFVFTIHIYAHPFRDPNVLEHLIKAQEETGYTWLCRSEDQFLTWQATSFALSANICFPWTWIICGGTVSQSNASFTNHRHFISKHFWNRTESKTLILQESSLEKQFNRPEDIFPKLTFPNYPVLFAKWTKQYRLCSQQISHEEPEVRRANIQAAVIQSF